VGTDVLGGILLLVGHGMECGVLVCVCVCACVCVCVCVCVRVRECLPVLL